MLHMATSVTPLTRATRQSGGRSPHFIGSVDLSRTEEAYVGNRTEVTCDWHGTLGNKHNNTHKLTLTRIRRIQKRK